MEYSKVQLDRIWNKGIKVEGYNPEIIRKDACGAWILRDSYGQEDSDYCWVVDHIYPQSRLEAKGIDPILIDSEVNLRPFNRKNNISKGDDYPDYKSVIVSMGDRNVRCEKYFAINGEVQKVLSNLFGLEG